VFVELKLFDQHEGLSKYGAVELPTHPCFNASDSDIAEDLRVHVAGHAILAPEQNHTTVQVDATYNVMAFERLRARRGADHLDDPALMFAAQLHRARAANQPAPYVRAYNATTRQDPQRLNGDARPLLWIIDRRMRHILA
jgi:hypothetical protein